LIALCGCPKKVETGTSGEPAPQAVVVLGAAIAPGQWHEAEGDLSVLVPEGWSGREGPPGGVEVFGLTHDGTGTLLRVRAWESGHPLPVLKAGCVVVVDDPGAHRAVPALPHAATASCTADEGGHSFTQIWYADSNGRSIQVEVTYPPTTAISGRIAVDPLLRGLTRR
jgi:hypothetical protein